MEVASTSLSSASDAVGNESGLRQRTITTATEQTADTVATDSTPSVGSEDNAEHTNETPAAGWEQFVHGLWSSIFTPGANSQLLLAMNVSFIALFLSLLFLLFATGGNGHVLALLLIAGGLFASIQWFVHELAVVRAANAANTNNDSTESTNEETSALTTNQEDLAPKESTPTTQYNNTTANTAYTTETDIKSKLESSESANTKLDKQESTDTDKGITDAASVPLPDDDDDDDEEEWSAVEREEAFDELVQEDKEKSEIVEPTITTS
ncbi:ER protein Pkr1-domain-containing protein [Syncephalis plumigaleata]|nr:ER protein Pkr1-domain-containing protein [Syncephalis plumigaleata]